MADVLPPLVVDGSVLAIPRASATQNGYLSREDYILFSGTTAVPVTSFNTRTGDIILLEDDVLAALGYVPLNKHGGTMTGPLILNADPVAALGAATRQFVLSQLAPAAGLPGVVLLSAYGTSGSPEVFTGNTSLGSTTLVINRPSDFVVGQGIFIAGAGPSSGDLVTKVNAIAGTSITLQNAASTSRSATKVQHDDTVALQTALNTQVAAGGGTIFVPPGFYRLNGPLGDFNSIIKLPFVASYPATSAGLATAVGLIAFNQPFPGFGPEPTFPGCAIFQTDQAGSDTNSAMFSAAPWVNNRPDLSSRLTLYMSNLTIQTYDNPRISGLDFGMCGNTILENITIDTGAANPSLLSEPTHGTFGIRTPQPGTGISADSFNMLTVGGYGIGIRFSEAFNSAWFVVGLCGVGMQCDSTSVHQAYGNCQLSQCKTLVQVNSPQPFDMNIDMQVDPNGSNWYYTPPGHDIYDPGNLATGIIKYVKVVVNSTSPGTASNTGLANCTLINMHGLGSRVAGTQSFADLVTTPDLNVTGTLHLSDGVRQEIVNFGPDNSADPGYRHLEVPNIAGGPGERTALWASGAGVETSLPGSLNTGLVSYWNFNEATGATVLDNHGSNNLIDAGGCTSQPGHVAPTSLARGFNGSSQYLAIGDGSQVGLNPGNSSFTISCWVYLNSKAATQTIIGKTLAPPAYPDAYFLQYSQASDKFLWVIADTALGYHQLPLSSFGSPPINTWIFIVAWLDASANKIYAQVNNGAVDMLDLAGAIPNASPGNFQIGAYGYPEAQLLNGRIDAVGFWNRVLST